MFPVAMRRVYHAGRRFAAASLLCGLVLGPGTARAGAGPWLAKAGPVRIMALGDSITAGVGAQGVDTGSGGYRGALERLLDTHSFHYTMIGGRSDYSAQVRMRAHEGWPGYVLRSFPSDRAPQLYGAVTKSAIESYDPDVILLMAGTNDLLRLAKHRPGYTISNIVESMDALLAQIFYLKPGVDVIVAGVVDSPRVHACDIAHFDGIPSEGECGEMDGPSVRTLVENFRARGFHISFASGMSGAVPRDKEHFPDGIHPSGPGGYEAVAQAWLQAIEDQTSDDATAVAGGLTNSPAFAGP